MNIQDINSEKLHHTYIVSGDRVGAMEEIISFIEEMSGVKTHGNSDVFIKEYDSFYIGDTREIRNLQQRRTLDKMQFFVLSMKEITHQAQNAFLKIAEDPTSNTCFFIVLPNHEVLLSTLKSRAVLIEHRGESAEYESLAQEFVQGTPKERLNIVGRFHGTDKVDKEDIGKFVSALEVYLRRNLYSHSSHTEMSVEETQIGQALHDVYDCTKKIQATGVSVKMLLDHLALVIPFKKSVESGR